MGQSRDVVASGTLVLDLRINARRPRNIGPSALTTGKVFFLAKTTFKGTYPGLVCFWNYDDSSHSWSMDHGSDFVLRPVDTLSFISGDLYFFTSYMLSTFCLIQNMEGAQRVTISLSSLVQTQKGWALIDQSPKHEGSKPRRCEVLDTGKRSLTTSTFGNGLVFHSPHLNKYCIPIELGHGVRARQSTDDGP